MWFKTFAERLESWHRLKQNCATADVESALLNINQWWFETPWTAYHLHWDDRNDWPDPWQLLSDNIFCSLARGLGIMYTITLINRVDLQDAILTEVGGDNLVLVGKEKYILNWTRDQIVNINPGQRNVRHSVTQQQIQQQIR